MNISKIFIGVVIVIAAILVFKNQSKSYDPIYYNQDTYVHIESTTHNKISNHFFTPDGIDIEESSKIIQITDASHPELSKKQVDIVRNQLISSMDLKPFKGSKNRYFGIFRKQHPIYAIERGNVFIMYYITSGFNSDKLQLRAHAREVLDSMDAIEVLL